MRTLIVILAALAVFPAAVFGQAGDGAAAPGTVAPVPGDAVAKTPADKSKVAKNAVRALKGDTRIHSHGGKIGPKKPLGAAAEPRSKDTKAESATGGR